MNLLKRYLQLNIKYFRYKCIKSHQSINGFGYIADLQCLDIKNFIVFYIVFLNQLKTVLY